MSELPFYTEDSVHALNCSKFDVVRPEALMIDNVKISNNLTFTDRVLPVTNRFLDENKGFPMSYFLTFIPKSNLLELIIIKVQEYLFPTTILMWKIVAFT